ncbi:hypothetical protein A3Q56_04917 [Intoshia linei]|uniref:Transglutaminase-like domain-containing protein n=1 Tax=Intoshia linei TaxID=1819745 RepID=A0A177B0V3_9BILA|nr:hypothetical protein A3Q56_04917 [Intoshia linei]
MNKKLVQTPSDTALNLQSRIYGQHDSYNTINETVLEKYNESLLVESVNFMIETNQIQNNTMNYYVVSNQMNNLIVRRGQSFTVCIRFNKPIEPRDILFILQTGSDPVESTGSLIRISITEKIIPSKWSCSISKFDQDYTFQFFAPSNAIFAKWNFIVQTAQRNNSYKYDYLWYKHTKSIIVLFNPWCVDDDIYMQNDEDIQEYILQNYVQIPLGSCIQHYMKCWLVSQIIKLTKFLEIQESHTSKINYVRSFNWTSSGSILASYFNNKNRDKEPITVSRNARILLLCTVCRTIGIPCRIVTGFFMSPLQKEYMNINLHWHHSGDDLHELDCDEIHDNHAWLEVWTKCPNFPQTVCWNAFDIAKNDCDDEKKMYGLYPVNLLRDGRTALRTNQLQLYWQINTDVCYNILQKDSSWIIKFDRLK